MDTFSARLASARALRGYSLRDLAGRAGLTHNGLWKLESAADADPKLSTVVALAAALDVDFAWLAIGEGKAPR